MRHKKTLLAFLLSTMACQGLTAGKIQDSLNVETPNPFGHTFMLSIGPSFITSPVYDMSTHLEHRWKAGMQFDARYTYIFRGGLGVGCLYSHSYTRYNSDHIKMSFIGPEVVYAARMGQQWKFYVTMAVGGEQVNSNMETRWRADLHESVIAEYQLSRHLAVGLNWSMMRVVLNHEKNERYDGDGISRMGLQASLNYHF